MKNHEESNEKFKKGLEKVEDRYTKMNKLYQEANKVVHLFRKEYKSGFERIVRCEIRFKEVTFLFE